VTGVRGVNFGYHWDAIKHLGAVRQTVETGILLPHSYLYPSMTYLLTLSCVAPEDVAAVASGATSLESFKAAVSPILGTREFLLRVRTVFIVLRALAILCVYAAVLAWRRGHLEATLAAGLLGTSWEFAYHSRWIAPDCLVVVLSAMTLLGFGLAVREGAPLGWFWLSCITAGLACATKYPSGLLLLPCLVAAWLTRGPSLKSRTKLALLSLLLFSAAFLVVTPGMVLEPFRFIDDVQWQRSVYGVKGHFGYTVRSNLVHSFKIVQYLGMVFFARHSAIAVLFFGFACFGTYKLVRESAKRAAVFLLFPVLYVLLFSVQRVMIVRNDLVVAPFLAILSARGTASLLSLIPLSDVARRRSSPPHAGR
jgi:4-amino-4-deoxy-L-arabinose transferase-like glycosyltransferase